MYEFNGTMHLYSAMAVSGMLDGVGELGEKYPEGDARRQRASLDGDNKRRPRVSKEPQRFEPISRVLRWSFARQN